MCEFSLQLIETVEITRRLSYYVFCKLQLNKHKVFFKFFILLSGDIELNQGPITNENENKYTGASTFQKCCM